MNTIMVVEDEAIIAIRLQERLTAMGYHIIGISYSGEEAMAQARRLRPDLILMDIMIPGKMDGIAVAKSVKTELDIPVIFLTAFSEDKIIDRAKQAEPYGYLVKPFQDRELKACVEVALYKKEMEKALKEAHDELELRVKERTRDLEIKTKNLEEMNTAMKVLLNKREEDKIEIEANVLTNVKELVMPFVDKFRETQLDGHQKTLLSIIESNLNEIISPFTRRLSLEYLNLTPTEIQIANMTKHGNTSKK